MRGHGRPAPNPCCTTEEELFVDIAKILPESVSVQNVGSQDLRCDPASHVLDTLAAKATIDSCKVSVCLGIALF